MSATDDMLPRLVERQRETIEQQRAEIVRLSVEARELRKVLQNIESLSSCTLLDHITAPKQRSTQ